MTDSCHSVVFVILWPPCICNIVFTMHDSTHIGFVLWPIFDCQLYIDCQVTNFCHSGVFVILWLHCICNFVFIIHDSINIGFAFWQIFDCQFYKRQIFVTRWKKYSLSYSTLNVRHNFGWQNFCHSVTNIVVIFHLKCKA